MSSLQRYESIDGVELVIDNSSGAAFATGMGYTRMSKKPKQTVSDRVQKLVRSGEVEEAKIDTGYGFKLVRLIPAKIVFRWLMKDNPALAEAMGEAGATIFMQRLAGYKRQQPKPPNPEPRYLPAIEQAEKAISVAERYKACFGSFNPMMEQQLKDLVGNTLVETNRMLKADQECWMGVVNFAELELKKSVPMKGEYRKGALGKWIRFYHPALSDRQERRFCNETQQEIWVYPVHECREELCNAVEEFFNHPSPGTQLRVDGAFKRK